MTKKEYYLFVRDLIYIRRMAEHPDFTDTAFRSKVYQTLGKDDTEHSAFWKYYLDSFSPGERYNDRTYCDLVSSDIENLNIILGRTPKPEDWQSGRNHLCTWIGDAYHNYCREFQIYPQTKKVENTLADRVVSLIRKSVSSPRAWFFLGIAFVLLAVCSLEALLFHQASAGLRRTNQDLLHENSLLANELSTLLTERTLSQRDAENKTEQPEIAPEPESQEESPVDPVILGKYTFLYEMNPEISGWLTIPGTEVDYPVVKGKGDFYLHHDFNGNESTSGSIFVNENSRVEEDNFIVVFGHNMRNGEMFGRLKAFLDEEFFEENRSFRFDSLYEERTYDIIAVLKTNILHSEEEGFRYYYTYGYDSEEKLAEIRDFISANAVLGPREDILYGDELVLLSTCESMSESSRLVIVGKKVGQP